MTMTIVDEAEQALRCWGRLTRAQASRKLGMWARRGELTDEQVEAVLSRFRGAR